MQKQIDFMQNPAEEVVISRKDWNRVAEKNKFKNKYNYTYLLQVFGWWTNQPQMFWRACIVK